jgi:nitrogen fixation protein FixH
MTKPPPVVKTITGRFVLIVTVCFFAVVIGVNLVMMRLAIATLPGTEVDSAYSASLAYEREIQAAYQQNQRHWKVEAHIERQTDGFASLKVRAHDAAGAALGGLSVSGRLERPTDRRGDLPLQIDENGNGEYRGTARGVAAGQWDLIIEANKDGQRLFLSRNRIILN